MKIYVKKTSTSIAYSKGQVMEFEDLEEAVNKLLADDEVFKEVEDDPRELIVSKPHDGSPDKAKDCAYVIEIYDTYRE